MVKFAKDLQFSKGLFPMWVTESGMVNFAIILLPWKALAAISVSWLGISTASKCSGSISLLKVISDGTSAGSAGAPRGVGSENNSDNQICQPCICNLLMIAQQPVSDNQSRNGSSASSLVPVVLCFDLQL